MSKTKFSAHIVYNCKYHIVFCPKYGRRILTGNIAERLKEIFLEVSREYLFEIIKMDIVSNYVHLYIDCSPEVGVMNCIRKLKATSYRKLRLEFPEIDRRLPTLWTRNAYISTVGSLNNKSIKEYIENIKKS